VNATREDASFLSLINSERNPTLDIATIEMPIQFQTTTTIDPFNSEFSSTNNGSSGEILDIAEDEFRAASVVDLPIFHNIHMRHRLPSRQTHPVHEEVIPSTTDSELQDFELLETIEQINFNNEQTSVHPTMIVQRPSTNPEQQYSPRFNFRPTNTRIVMTHKDLLASMKEMLARQEGEIDAERKFLDTLLRDGR
jgi:hypothetical protein